VPAPAEELLRNKIVVLGICGGIAAYKSAELVRLLVKAGAQVHVVMTSSAQAFITPLTLQTLSGNPVATELFDLTQESEIGHIALADKADVIVVAPCTANALGRLAAGIADDILSTVVLASPAPVVLAPAMNVNMWRNPLVQGNLERLTNTERFSTVGPGDGELACGWIGQGRLSEPSEILAGVAAVVDANGDSQPGVMDLPLQGQSVVVSAGGTREPVDSVRFLGNRSSGKMGFAIAEAAAALGASVSLVAAPVCLPTPKGVRRHDVETALEMQAALEEWAADADWLVMAAAVADFRPEQATEGKLSRRDGVGALALAANPDILAGLASARVDKRPVLVGFAAETDASQMKARALKKLNEKGCDAVVANCVAGPQSAFDSPDNEAVIVFGEDDSVELARAPKLDVARHLWRELVARFVL